MLDNKSLSESVKQSLSHLAYEEMVRLYDTFCKGCPFALYIVKHTLNTKKEFTNYEEARKIAVFTESNIFRGCTYNADYFTLREIINNTCKMWSSPPTEEGEFIEIERIEDVKRVPTMDRLYPKEV